MIVGGGKVAYRKVMSLLETGAFITIVSKEIINEIRDIEDSRIKIYLKDYEDSDLIEKKYSLVIAATSDSSVNANISSLCNKMNIPVNVVDIPGLCSFFAPSIIKRGDLTISISTDGKCPAFSKYLRKKLDKIIPLELDEIIAKTGEYRSELIKMNIDEEEKKKLINSKIEEEIGKLKW